MKITASCKNVSVTRSLFVIGIFVFLGFTPSCTPSYHEVDTITSYNLQTSPVLHSAIELYHDGKRGVWIEESDVANLMMWINNIKYAAGQ